MGQQMVKHKYSVTVLSNDGKDATDRCSTIQEVIGYIVECMGWYECADTLNESEITVYIAGTDDLVAFKSTNEAIEDFIVELSKESFALEEKGLTSSEWIQKLDKNRGPEKSRQFIEDYTY